MTDPRLLAVYALGPVIGLALGLASFVGPSERPAKRGAAVGAVWLVADAAIVLGNISSGPLEYLVPPVVAALIGVVAGWVSYRLAQGGRAAHAGAWGRHRHR
jgi:hypothetical protein